jgi:stage II sporulation protein M
VTLQSQAESIFEWYRIELPLTLKQLRQPLMIVLGIAIVAGIASYLWVVVNVPAYLDLSPERLTRFRTLIGDSLVDFDKQLPAAPVLFYHNARTTVVLLLLGLVSFGTLGLTLFIGNIALVGGLLGGAQLVGYSPLLVFVTGILPHGIFELSAIILATAAMLKVGAQLVTPQPDKSLGEILLLSIADWCRIFIGIVVPLLAIAALIEIYVTPQLIKLAFSP